MSVHDVDVWRLDCARHVDAGGPFDSSLDDDERARLRRMQNPLARLHFAAGRWLARHVLALRLGCASAAIEIAMDPRGRPALVAGGFDFNLSHAGSRVVLALSTTRVGIDVETHSRSMRWCAIARRFFSRTEIVALEACAESARRMAFFRAWVRKEAFVKALGTGVATGLDRFDVNVGPEAALLATRIEGVEATDWSIRDFDPGAGYSGAVAVRATRARLRVHDIEP